MPRSLAAKYISEHLEPSDNWLEDIEAAMAEGQVVFAVLSGSFFDVLALQELLSRHQLPPIEAVLGEPGWFAKLVGVPSWTPGRGRAPRVAAVTLPYNARFQRPKQLEQTDARLRSLVSWHRGHDGRVFVVPCTLLWSKSPPPVDQGPVDLVLGTGSEPRRLRRFSQALVNRRHAVFRHAPPVEVEAPAHTSVEQASSALRRRILRAILRERALVHGPTRKEPRRVLEELLRSPRFQRHVAVEARVTKRTPEEVKRDVRRELLKLAAAQDPGALRWLHRTLQWTWKNVYQGVEVDEAGIDRLRKCARDGAVVLVPSHRSHFDYLVLSDVLYDRALSPPLIAAGDNLNFWPVGPMLRKGGAFFIRRSFRGQKLYPALVEAYVRKLLREGYSLEFFIEGGRSRTGRVLAPKLGLLSMLVDSALLLKDRDVFFVPISVSYDRVPEVRAYVAEQFGAEKAREDLLGLLKGARMLQRSHGKVYVHFGEVQSLDQAVRQVCNAAPETPRPPALTPKQRRTVVQQLAQGITRQIAAATPVTPITLVASALILATRHETETTAELQTITADADALFNRMRRHGAPYAQALRGEHIPSGALWQALRLLEAHEVLELDGTSPSTARVKLDDTQRLELDFYRCTTLPYLLAEGTLALAALTLGDALRRDAWLERTLEIAQRLRAFFGADAHAQVSRDAPKVLDDILVADALVTRSADQTLRWQGHHRCLFRAAGQLMPDVEAIQLTIEVLKHHTAEAVPLAEWVGRAQTQGQQALKLGTLSFPESLTRSRIESALTTVKELGLLATAEPGHIAAATELASAAERLAWVGEAVHQWRTQHS